MCLHIHLGIYIKSLEIVCRCFAWGISLFQYSELIYHMLLAYHTSLQCSPNNNAFHRQVLNTFVLLINASVVLCSVSKVLPKLILLYYLSIVNIVRLFLFKDA